MVHGANAANRCAKDQLKTETPGTLTVATDKPAFPPCFEENDPTNGRGFESAVADRSRSGSGRRGAT
jgi:polar amino acid transport system substrate-binding protein